MIFGDYKKVIKKGYYVQCDNCGDVTLMMKGDCTLCTCCDWWKYMYDKKHGYYTDVQNTSNYGVPGWHITKETVTCPKCWDANKLANALRNLSDESYAKLKELVNDVEN